MVANEKVGAIVAADDSFDMKFVEDLMGMQGIDRLYNYTLTNYSSA